MAGAIIKHEFTPTQMKEHVQDMLRELKDTETITRQHYWAARSNLRELIYKEWQDPEKSIVNGDGEECYWDHTDVERVLNTVLRQAKEFDIAELALRINALLKVQLDHKQLTRQQYWGCQRRLEKRLDLERHTGNWEKMYVDADIDLIMDDIKFQNFNF